MRTRALLFGSAAVLTVALIASSAACDGPEQQAQALIASAAPRPKVNPDVVVVAWDERQTTAVSRKDLARVLRALKQAGAKAILLDGFFSTPALDGPASDEALASAAKDSSAVLAVACRGGSSVVAAELKFPERGVLSGGPDPVYRCASPLMPSGELSTASLLGGVMFTPEPSSYARRAPIVIALPGEKRLLSLAALGYALGRGASLESLAQKDDGVHDGSGLLVPTEPDGSRLIAPRQDPKIFSIAELLANLATGDSFTPELAQRFSGRYVIYGLISRDVGDWGPYLDGRVGPLSFVHAFVLSDLLEGRSLKQASWPVRFILAVVLGFLLCAFALRARPMIAAAMLFAISAIFWVICVESYRRGFLLYPLGPLLSAFTGFGATLTVRLVERERQQALLKDAFASYVDPLVLRRVLDEPDRFLSLEGARKRVTVLFADIAGYTQMTNRLPPEQSISLLREYLSVVTRLVKDAGGRVDKIMGDGVMAVFGDPMPIDDHARVAVEVAEKMQRAVVTLSASPAAHGQKLSIRIGIATGDAFVGNIGAKGSKIEYTVLGATVNLASRLEGKCPAAGVVVSTETKNACPAAQRFTPMPGLQLKGFDEPVDAWLLGGG